MRLSDRIRRWWNPGQWRDDHPEGPSDGEDSATLSASQSKALYDAYSSGAGSSGKYPLGTDPRH
jgi:hypothetical protein